MTGYRLWRQTGEAAFAVVGSDLAASALGHTDLTVQGGTTYQYRLQALAAAGPGARTAAVSIAVAAVPAPARPALAFSQQTGPDSLDLEGDTVAGATAYELQFWAEDPAGNHWVGLDPLGPTAVPNGSQPDSAITLTFSTDTPAQSLSLTQLQGLPDSYSRWSFQLRATNAGGVSPWSRTYRRTRRSGPYDPATPRGLAAASTGSGTVHLTWQAVATATAYRLELQEEDAGYIYWQPLPVADITAVFTGASVVVSGLPATPAVWHFRLWAVNAQGPSFYSRPPLTVPNPDV